MTTTPDAGALTSSVTSSSSSSSGFYFQCVVVGVGVVGAAANALILYALVVSKHHSKHLLIFNQNALDFASCVFQVRPVGLYTCYNAPHPALR